jgi:hypothetical protein
VTSFRAGALIAAAVAGPPLWLQVRAGSIDATTAIERGALVALACTAGAGGIGRLVRGYQRSRQPPP